VMDRYNTAAHGSKGLGHTAPFRLGGDLLDIWNTGSEESLADQLCSLARPPPPVKVTDGGRVSDKDLGDTDLFYSIAPDQVGPLVFRLQDEIAYLSDRTAAAPFSRNVIGGRTDLVRGIRHRR